MNYLKEKILIRLSPILLRILLRTLLTIGFTTNWLFAIIQPSFAERISVCPLNKYSELPLPPLSQTQLSIPSLWLAIELFGENILEHWYVYENTNWIVLLINKASWLNMNYLDKYQLVHQFGTVAGKYRYNIQFCHPSQNKPLAVYFCDYTNNISDCFIDLDPRYTNSLWKKPKLNLGK